MGASAAPGVPAGGSIISYASGGTAADDDAEEVRTLPWGVRRRVPTTPVTTADDWSALLTRFPPPSLAHASIVFERSAARAMIRRVKWGA